MIADKELIHWLLFKWGESAAEISRGSGVPATNIKNLRSGKATIDSIRFYNAVALTEYAKEKKKQLMENSD